jgi:type VI secretion system secreted protein VgrG
MLHFTQDNRTLAMATPLGEDVLLLAGFEGEEALSGLFRYQLTMYSESHDISPSDIVGQNVTWCVQTADWGPQFFNGFVSRFAAGSGRIQGLRAYRAEVVPWLWFLTRTANCRIFQNKSTPEIIETVFKDLGFTDYELVLRHCYPKREYCVQYRETAFNFVSRLMEQEGIFYFFRHENGKHTLVLADQNSVFEECPDSPVSYTEGSKALNHISSWDHQYAFRSGRWAQTDYYFETPSANLLTTTDTLVDIATARQFEVFDYPGDYRVKDAGKSLTRVRMEEEEASFDVMTGASTCATFTPGAKFTLTGHEANGDVGKPYVLTSVQHSARDASYDSTAGKGKYTNTFTCIPASVAFRPTRTATTPVVFGAQTAVVVGPRGQEIYTDKYGRIKVQFFWDREGKKDENSSCWMRVSEAWAGKGWGVVSTPRIGQEVIVDFLEGDPDRPLVTGRVFNAEQMPPFNLPGGRNITGLKSNSTPGGGGYNEISVDDTKGKEKVTIHAQHDMGTTVEHDEALTIHHDRTKIIDHDETTHVKHDRTETVDNNETIVIGANRMESVKANESITVLQTRTRMVGINESVTVGGAQEITVGGLRAVTVGATQTISVVGSETENFGGNHTQTVGGNQSVQVVKSRSLKVGGGQLTEVAKDAELKVGKKLVIQAGEEILISTGDASILLKKDGTIQIKGKDILVQGSGKITEKAAGDFVIKGSKVGIN